MRLTITPPYLDPNSHEALYEIDETVLNAGVKPKPGRSTPGLSMAGQGKKKSMTEAHVSHSET